MKNNININKKLNINIILITIYMNYTYLQKSASVDTTCKTDIGHGT